MKTLTEQDLRYNQYKISIVKNWSAGFGRPLFYYGISDPIITAKYSNHVNAYVETSMEAGCADKIFGNLIRNIKRTVQFNRVLQT